MRVSHETIYRTLFIQARGALKKELIAHLRTQRPRRRPHHAQGPQGGSIRGELSISQRPAEVEDRAVPGHWEGDLLCGSQHSQSATLVERRSRFVMLEKVSDKNSVILRVSGGMFAARARTEHGSGPNKNGGSSDGVRRRRLVSCGGCFEEAR